MKCCNGPPKKEKPCTAATVKGVSRGEADVITTN